MLTFIKHGNKTIGMKLGILFSGGKDSCLAMHKAMKENEIVCLISLISSNQESYMFHTPNIHIVEMQAKAIGLPLVKVETAGEKEKELLDLEKAIECAKKLYLIEGIVTGAMGSEYQAGRIQKICDKLGLKCINPLWHMDQIEELHELIREGFEVIISGVFAYPLDEKLLGKQIDAETIKTLAEMQAKYKINPAGEGGEIETTVLNAPFFKQKIKIVESKTEYNNNSGIFRILNAELAGK